MVTANPGPGRLTDVEPDKTWRRYGLGGPPCPLRVQWEKHLRPVAAAHRQTTKGGNSHLLQGQQTRRSRTASVNRFVNRDAAGQPETGETQNARGDLMPQVCRGQRGDRGLSETGETLVVWLITQRSEVQILARTLKLPPWRRPGNPLVLVKHSKGCLKPVRPAKPLKPRRDLRVIQVWMIAAAGADQLIHVGVAALDTAVHDADRLAAQDRIAAVTGLTGGRGCHDLLRHDTQAPVTAIAGTRCGDSRRTDSRSVTRRRARGARTAHATHRREVGLATTGGLEQRRCYHHTIHAGRAKDMSSRGA